MKLFIFYRNPAAALSSPAVSHMTLAYIYEQILRVWQPLCRVMYCRHHVCSTSPLCSSIEQWCDRLRSWYVCVLVADTLNTCCEIIGHSTCCPTTRTVTSDYRWFWRHIYLVLVTFCVRHSRGEMYIDHGRLCVCFSPNSHTAARTRM